MAKNIKSVNLLPEIFRTDKNSKFLDSTIDQLIQKPQLERIDGYIGSKDTPTYNSESDYYIPDTSSVRSNYQFNPTLVIKDEYANIQDSISLDDLINEIKVRGGNVDNLDRLFKSNIYSYNPHIDWDKLINYQEYYWLPTGPSTITITGRQKNSTSTFTVQDDELGTSFIFTPDGLTADPLITLYRGNTYNFSVNSQHNFYIKTAPSVGQNDIYSVGVINNGTSSGVISLVIDENTPSSLFYISGDEILSQGQFVVKNIEEDSYIDVEEEILGKKDYIFQNGLSLSNGMKVRFGGTVVPSSYQNKEFFVEGVGESIRLINYDDLTGAANLVNVYNDNFDVNGFDVYPFDTFKNLPLDPEYITINRASEDKNPWSCYNRWIHGDVIRISALANNTEPVYPIDKRAKRPIIEFKADIKLYNFGSTSIKSVDLLDTTTVDALNDVVGTSGYYVDGVLLEEGQRVIFNADSDSEVRNKIYRVHYIIDGENISLELIVDDDLTSKTSVSTVINLGDANAGDSWWFNGDKWIRAQQHTKLNEAPLFDLFDKNGNSYSDVNYYNTNFKGNKIFGYAEGEGKSDPVLGFPLKYQNTAGSGSYLFYNYFASDQISISAGFQTVYTVPTYNTYVRFQNNISVRYENVWSLAREKSLPILQFQTTVESTSTIRITAVDNVTANDKIDVFINQNKLDQTKYVSTVTNKNNFVQFTDNIPKNSNVLLKIYSNSKPSTTGYYETPINLSNNPLNENIDSFTLTELTDHVKTIVNASDNFEGVFPGKSNLRDLTSDFDLGSQLISNESSLAMAQMFIGKKEHSLINAISKSADHYNQFKLSFLRKISELNDQINLVDTVDLALKDINKDKDALSLYNQSDMLGYGTDKTIRSFKVSNPNNKSYPLIDIFDITKLSTRSVLVYLNDQQLLINQDYTFDLTDAVVTIKINLNRNDTIKIVDYSDTTGSFVPPTPTKLGLYPKFEPKIFVDESYASGPKTVIQGHDGSITLAYNDFRDQIILELEKRIYNNLKTNYNPSLLDYRQVIPGAFRNTEYSISEVNDILQRDFIKWAGQNGLDPYTNDTFDINNIKTWNYADTYNYDLNKSLFGTWRAVFNYFYDTDRPNTHPWEMLGFSIKPDWWEQEYGPAPYTSGNDILWQDLEQGMIKQGSTSGVNSLYARPGLSNYLPVDEYGNLLDPTVTILTNVTAFNQRKNWKFGDFSPVETAWRRSSYWPFAVQTMLALSKPAKYAALMYNPHDIVKNIAGQLVYSKTNTFLNLKDVSIPKESIEPSSGYSVYVSEIGSQRTTTYTSDLRKDLTYLSFNLQHKVGGFISKNKIQILVDSYDPVSASQGGLLPPENYKLILNTSNPIKSVSISGVIVQKNNGKFQIKGYDVRNPFFTIYNPLRNFNTPTITIGGVSESFVDWAAGDTPGNTGLTSVDLTTAASATTSKFYQKGQIVRYGNKFYRVKTSHQADANFNITNFQQLPSLPTVGGATVQLANTFEKTEVIVPYGTEYTTLQEVYDLLVGYGEWLKDQGFVFEQYNDDLSSVIDWYYSGKEFLYWSTQNWADQSIITLSPFADKITYSFPNSIVENVFDAFYEYSVLQANGISMPQTNLNVSRVDGICSIETVNITDGIYFATINSVQKEHAIIFDNVTMFNDTIYEPSTGYRQRRIKLSGFRTADWNGDYYSPGFVYDEAESSVWKKYAAYKAGDIVFYNSKYYTAKQNISGDATFDFNKWVGLDNKPEQALIPNFDYKINQFEDFYSLDIDNFDTAQQKMAQHLIGYTPRSYLNNIFTNPIAQYKFYQGFIKEKGTKNSVSKLAKASIHNLQGELEFNEEWAFRIGHYGGFNTYQELEVPLVEGSFIENPQIINFVDTVPVKANDLIVYNTATDRVITPENYSSNHTFITSNDNFKLEHAGYVRLDDVTATAYNENSLLDIANNGNIKEGDVIWLGFKNNGSWDVLRYTALPVKITNIDLDAVNGLLRFTTDGYHGLKSGQLVSISQYTTQIDAVYTVKSVTSLFNFTVSTNLTSIDTSLDEGPGLLFSFMPVRLNNFDNIFTDNILLNLSVGSKVWVDNSGDGTWSVYEKTNNYANPIVKNGWQLDKLPNSNVLLAGDPENNLETFKGRVWVYKQSDTNLQLNFSYTINDNINSYYDPANSKTEFGASLAYDSKIFNNTGYGIIFAGAPGVGKTKSDNISGGLRTAYSTGTASTRVEEGLVKISSVDPVLIEEKSQVVLLSPDPQNYQRFGQSLYVQQNSNSKLLLVGAPGTITTGSGKVYVYSVSTSTLNSSNLEASYLRALTLAASTGSQWGYSISGSDNAEVIAVSAPNFNSGNGRVVVYTGTNTDVLQIINPIGQLGQFGQQLRVSPTGKYLLISAPFARNADQSMGNVSIYKRLTSTGTFTLESVILNPVPGAGMRFGCDIDISEDEKSIVISALGTKRYITTAYDTDSAYLDDTIFDSGSSQFYDDIVDSGTAYVYERKENRFALANELFTTATTVLKYGSSVLFDKNAVYVGAIPSENGSFYQFKVKDSTKTNWNKVRYQNSLTNIDTIQKITLIDTFKESVIDYLDVIDPLKGKIAGLADQEIKYKAVFDPAVYSIGIDATIVDTNTNWLDERLGELWWDLSTTKYIWYEQGDLVYRKNNWGRLFPGSTIDVYEWVGTPYLPSEWSALADTPQGLTEGISGQPKYADNSVVSVKQIYDSVSNTFTNYYYYWVKNKVTVPNVKNRRISSFQVASLIADPTAYGLKYAMIIDEDAIAVSNVNSLLVDKNIHINIGLDQINNSIPRHTEWLLLQENNAQSVPNTLLEKKLIDSLLGHDSIGNPVPDPILSERQKYGVSIRPRQTLFKNRFEALRNLTEFANSVLKVNLIAGKYNFENLNQQELVPDEILGEYDQIVEDNEGLALVDTRLLSQAELSCTVYNGKIRSVSIDNPGFGYKIAPTVQILGNNQAKIQTTIDSVGKIIGVTIKDAGNGFTAAPKLVVRPYTVIVLADNQYNRKWTKFAYQNQTWIRVSTQKYNTPLYWKYIDWVSKDYNQYQDYEFTVDAVYQLDTLTSLTDGQYVKVKNSGDGRYIIVKKVSGNGTFSSQFDLMYSESGTIQILDSIWDYKNNNLGFDQNNNFDQTLFDQTPDIELQYILKALKNDLFVNELKINWNLFFFKAVKYALTEQKLLDWAFKTSFINVINRAGALDQRPVYKLQNSTYYENYLKEVKPYHTNIRSFTTNYSVLEPTETYTTDFDLPSVYDKETGKFISLSDNDTMLTEYPWKSWADNYKFEIGSISVGDGGSGYTLPPNITIQAAAGDTGSGATAKAYIQSGKVISIEVTNPGKGYKKSPIVIINGGGNTLLQPARAYAQLRNTKVRNTLIGIKFDRTGLGNTSGGKSVVDTFICNGLTNEFVLNYLAQPDKLKINVKLNGAIVLSADYKVVYYEEKINDYNKQFSKIVFLNYVPISGQILEVRYEKNINLFNATERILNEYKPITGMPGIDVTQLMTGMEYPKTTIETLAFDHVLAWAGTNTNYTQYDLSAYSGDVKNYKTVSVAATATTGTNTITLTTVTGIMVGQKANIISYVTNKFSTSTQVIVTATNTVTNSVSFSSTLSGSVVPGDVIEFWENDANFSILDSVIEGGTWSTSTSNYLVGALGLTPSDIVLSGDAFITENNSFAPEELVPGHVYDTLGVNVYTKSLVTAPIIFAGNFNTVANTTTTSQLAIVPPNKDSISVVFDATTILRYTSSTNFTSANQFSIDWSNGNIIVPPQNRNGMIGYTIVSVGGGSGNSAGVLDNNIVVTNNTLTVSVASLSNVETVKSVYVTRNGEKVPEASTSTQYGYMLSGTDQAVVTVYNMPFGITNTVQVWFFADPYDYFNEVSEQLFVVGNSQQSLFGLTKVPGTSGPAAVQMIVEVSNTQGRRRLLPPWVSYYDVTNSINTTFDINNKQTYFIGAFTLANTKAYINGRELRPGFDFTVDSVNATITIYPSLVKPRDVVAVMGLVPNDVAVWGPVPGTYNYDYNLADTTLALVTPVNNATVRVITYTNHDSMLMRTERFKGNSAKRYRLSYPVMNDRYVWVQVNGIPLTSGLDFELLDDQITVQIRDPFVHTINDDIVISSMSSNSITNNILGYRIFTDIFNRTHFKRLSKESSTHLIQPLSVSDTEIYVEDASVLTPPVPSKKIPGVILIAGERIEFLTIQSNVLKNIRRGTLGTSPSNYLDVNTKVIDQNFTQTVPYSEQILVQKILTTNTNTYAISTVTSTSTGDGIILSAGISLVDQVSVYYGGRLLNKTGSVYFDNSVSYDIGNFNVKGSTSSVQLLQVTDETKNGDSYVITETSQIWTYRNSNRLNSLNGYVYEGLRYKNPEFTITTATQSLILNLTEGVTDNVNLVIVKKQFNSMNVWNDVINNSTTKSLLESTSTQAEFLKAGPAEMPDIYYYGKTT